MSSAGLGALPRSPPASPSSRDAPKFPSWGIFLLKRKEAPKLGFEEIIMRINILLIITTTNNNKY